MKHINHWLLAATGLLMLTSCADEFDTNSYVVSRPGSAELYDYLNDYQPLKEYLDRSAHPNFKVSAALTASTFNQKGMLYALAQTNFDEIVAGNAMKMASCVDDKGNMDFGTVTSFVNTAEDAGLTVYGHTLAWHSQQPVKYLQSLIADVEIPVDDTADDTPAYEVYVDENFDDGNTTMIGWGNGSTRVIEDGVMHWNNPSVTNSWSAQAAYDFAEEIPAATTLKLRFKVRGSTSGTIGIGMQDPSTYGGCGNFDDCAITEDWTTYEGKCTVSAANAKRFIFSFGAFAGDIYLDDLKLYSGEEAVNVYLVNEDFDNGSTSMGGWGNGSTRTIEDGVMHWNNPSVTNSWSAQAAYDFAEEVPAATTLYLTMKVRASGSGSMGIGMQDPSTYGGCGNFDDCAFTEEWSEYSSHCTVNAANAKRFIFSFGAFAGDIYLDDIQLYYKEENTGGGGQTGSYWMNVITNSDMTGSDFSNFIVREPGKADAEGPGYAGEGPDGGYCVKITSHDNPTNAWDTQFFITSSKTWEGGEKYKISFDYKASQDATCSTQCHGAPGSYLHWQMLSPTPSFTTEWQHYELESTIPGEGDGMQTIAFNLNELGSATTYYFANIEWSYEITGNTRPQTDEEKKAHLTTALTRWINGIVAATGGKVKAWDLANETVSGSGNVDGYYALQHGTDDTNFYWQDYLGDVDYVVIAEKAAREAYAAIEGTNPSDLKLFINDYNLESTWDNNKKLESLIYWIGKWEEAGAQIDGIGSQMHISYYLDATKQKSQEEHITRMLELMAKTGKLVRISELDMGVIDLDGNAMQTEDLTFDIEKQMADYYQWIIEQYLSIVPTAQQYGICQWCLTDSPASSSWRAGQPVGLWTEDYLRKPAYAGWAEGLKK